MFNQSSSSNAVPVPAVASRDILAPNCPEEWRGCAPNVVLDLMRKLEKPNLGSNTGKFYKTYGLWQNMPAVHINKSLAWFRNLPVATQTEIVTKARNTSVENVAVEKERAETVHKNDLVRLLELSKWPDAQMLWQRTREPMNRATLDARNSDSVMNAEGTATMADDADPFSALAAHFNDYEGFVVQNRLLAHHNVGGRPVPICPARAADSSQTILALKCFDLNPTDISRAAILRDGAWIKARWLLLRHDLSYLINDFNRSGYHTAADEAEVEWLSPPMYQSWINFASSKNRHFPQVLVYAYAVLSEDDLHNLGKEMEPGMGRDCSLAGAGAAKSAVYDGGKKRRLVQQKAKEMRKKKGWREGEGSLAKVIERATIRDGDISILSILAKSDSKHNKRLALKRLTGMLSFAKEIPLRKVNKEESEEEEEEEDYDSQDEGSDANNEDEGSEADYLLT